MNKNYELPTIEILILEISDVLTSSAELEWPWGGKENEK